MGERRRERTSRADHSEGGQLMAPARSAGSHVADGLVRRGTALAARGRLLEAARCYEQAAGLHRKAGRRLDEGRSLLLLGQCERLVGELERARHHLERAERLAGENELTVSVVIELSAVLRDAGDLDLAQDSLTRALTLLGDEATVMRAQLLRRRAIIEAARARTAPAEADFEASATMFGACSDELTALRVRIEGATALHSAIARSRELAHVESGRAARALESARREADRLGDDAAMGELDLLEAAAAVAREDWETACSLAESARNHALARRSPTLYVGACVALADLADLRGDRLSAYRQLATGWASLADLLGRARAAQVFSPRMKALEDAWGGGDFAAVRAEYERQRRDEIAAAAGSAADYVN
jgi:tetratricopeptide (TPR) repeat protein